LSLQDNLLVYRSDAPLPKVFRPLHETSSSHQPFIDSYPDSTDLAELSDKSSDEDTTLAENVKGKAVEYLDREESPEPEAKQLCVRGMPVLMLGN